MPWGITFHNQWAAEYSGTPLNRPLHPTQLYEFVAEVINFAFLYWLCKRKKFEGQMISLYMIIYGTSALSLSFSAAIRGGAEVLGGLISGNTVDRARAGGERLLDLSSPDSAAIGEPSDGLGQGGSTDGVAGVRALGDSSAEHPRFLVRPTGETLRTRPHLLSSIEWHAKIHTPVAARTD